MYGHSKLLSLLVLIAYTLSLYTYQLIFKLFGWLIARKQVAEWHSLSFQFRSRYYYNSLDALSLKFQHLIPDSLLLAIATPMSNYSMGTFTTTPSSANIYPSVLSKASLDGASRPTFELHAALRAAKVDDANIDSVRLLWIYGNDAIEERYKLTNEQGPDICFN